MGHKVVCLDCRKAFSQGTDYNNLRATNCPDCGKPMLSLSHQFRPPKKTDNKKWEAVKYLVEHGFYYYHIPQKRITDKGEIISQYAKYQEDIQQAKEFVETYKEYAVNKKNG